jgi:hypothetical protein
MSSVGRSEKFDREKVGASVEETVHPDGTATSIDPVREQALVRKLDRRILPIACLMYMFACECCCFKSAPKPR